MYKEKILAELNKRFLGLSKKVLGLIADKLSAKVTEESQIEGAINELDNLPISVKDFGDLLRKEGDERVTAAQKKWALENPKKPEEKKTEGADDSDPVAKKLAIIEQKLAERDRRGKSAELTEKAKKTLTEKKIPHRLLNGRIIEKDEDLETVLAEVEADWTDMKQELANQGFVESPKPVNGAGGDTSKKVVVSDIKNWAANAQPQPAATK